MFSHRFTVPGRKWLPTVSCLVFTGFGINALINGIATEDLWMIATGACCFLLATGSMLLSTQKHLGEIRWDDNRFAYTVDDREIVSCSWQDIVSVKDSGAFLKIHTRQRWRRFAVPRAGMPAELKQLLTKQTPPPAEPQPSVETTATPADEAG